MTTTTAGTTATGTVGRRPTPIELAAFLGLGTPTAVRAGCVLATEGEPGRDAFLVVDGVARVTKDGWLVGEVGPGDFVGELGLIDHAPRLETVVAVSPMQVLTFDARSFAALLAEPVASRELQRQLAARLRSVLDGTAKTQGNHEPTNQQENQS